MDRAVAPVAAGVGLFVPRASRHRQDDAAFVAAAFPEAIAIPVSGSGPDYRETPRARSAASRRRSAGPVASTTPSPTATRYGLGALAPQLNRIANPSGDDTPAIAAAPAGLLLLTSSSRSGRSLATPVQDAADAVGAVLRDQAQVATLAAYLDWVLRASAHMQSRAGGR